MSTALQELLARHKAGEPVGVTSVCSAEPFVLGAAAAQAVEDGGVLLVEATSNQVDQFGGYTGMRPADFSAFVAGVCAGHGLDAARLVLGGDHLGPNRWQDRAPDEAMALAEDLVSEYAAAGYTKIHLDCSMRLAGDPQVLPDALVAGRAARLLRAADAAAPDPGKVVYVVGTEVPVPGGAQHDLGDLPPTDPAAARATVAAHKAAFAAAGLGHLWPQVVGLVVQPGVEFDHAAVVDYRPQATAALQRVLDDEPSMVFEAHSTDYQLPGLLRQLVVDHWAVLKVGPGLTYALREAWEALACIDADLHPDAPGPSFPAALEAAMVADPTHWRSHYTGGDDARRLARRYSYSDRSRYYLGRPEVRGALDAMVARLSEAPVPETMLSRHLPDQYRRVRRGELAAEPVALATDRVRDVLRAYAAATRP